MSIVGIDSLDRLAMSKEKRRALSIVHLFVEEITHALVRIRLRVEGNDIALQSIASAAFQSPYADTILLFLAWETKSERAAVHFVYALWARLYKRSVAFTKEFQVAPRGMKYGMRGWKLYASAEI